jgi:hypothetical protein
MVFTNEVLPDVSRSMARPYQKVSPVLVVWTKGGPVVKGKQPAEEDQEEGGSASITATTPDEEDNQDEIEKWEDLNSKALGSMRLRLHHSIAYKYNNVENAGKLWTELQKEYGAQGKTALYLEFKAVLDMPFPTHSDPCVMLDNMGVHFGRMAEAQVPVPDYLQVMMVLAKIPPSMESLSQVAAVASSDSKAKDMKMDGLRKLLANLLGPTIPTSSREGTRSSASHQCGAAGPRKPGVLSTTTR